MKESVLMKSILFIFFVFCFKITIAQNNDITPNHYENADSILRQNHIKKEIILRYLVEKNQINGYPTYRYELIYSNVGKLTELGTAYKANKLIPTESLFYGPNNLLLKTETYGDTGKTKIWITGRYVYDSLGNELSYNSVGSQGSVPPSDTIKIKFISKKLYNEKNQLWELLYNVKNTDSVYVAQKYYYHESGILDKIDCFDEHGHFNNSDFYIRKKGSVYCLEGVELNKARIKSVFTQDKNGRCEKIQWYFYANGKPSISEQEFSYNTDGTIDHEIFKRDGKVTEMKRHSYSTL